MAENADDPWKLLADDLGVQPKEEPNRQAPPPATPNTGFTSSFRTPPPPPSHKKPPVADWNALAGELGLKPTPAGAPPTAKPDPVAELLGIPPTSGQNAFEPTKEKPKYRDADPEFDEFDDYDPRPRRENTPDDSQPLSSESGRASAEQPIDPRDIDPRDGGNEGITDRTYRPSRRRGRRGRGSRSQDRRDEPGRRDRPGRSGPNREPNRDRGSRPGSPHQGQRSDRRPIENQPKEVDRGVSGEFGRDDGGEHADRDHSLPASDEFGAGIADSENNVGGEGRSRESGDQELRPKRGRRRGRRGRGSRGRSERPDRPEAKRTTGRSESAEPRQSDDLHSDSDLDDDSELLEGYLSAEPGNLPSGGDADDHLGDDDDHAGDLSGDLHTGRNSVRDIMTWKEAIGLIIENNLQGRSRAPQSQTQGGSHNHQRGGPRGRGRGRGRGPGRGNHRS